MEKELESLIIKYKTCLEQLNEINTKAEKVNDSEKVITEHSKQDAPEENEKINQMLNKLKTDVSTVLSKRKLEVATAKVNVQSFIDNALWRLFSRTELQNNALLFNNDSNRRKDKKILMTLITTLVGLHNDVNQEEYSCQLQEWTLHVATIYLAICSSQDKVKILKLLTTTSNIDWAVSLLQFNDLNEIEDYFNILRIIFRPENNWIEDDYLAVLDQLAIDFTFNKLIIEKEEEKDVIKSTQTLTDILTSGIHSLSAMNSVVKRVSQTLVQISLILTESNITLDQDKLDEYLVHLAKEFYKLKKNGWFFLSNIPFKSLSVNGLWDITLHLLQLKIDKPTNITQVLNEENLPNISRFQIELKNNQELNNNYFILNCLTNITTCIPVGIDKIINSEDSILSTFIIIIISFTLFTIAFVDKNLREIFYKDVRDNFDIVTKHHSFTISLLFRWTVENISIMERMSLYLFHSISLNNWNILKNDLKLLHQLLTSSKQYGLQFGKYIIEELNFDYQDSSVDSTVSKSQPWHNRKLPFLDYEIHEEIAFILLDACQQFQPIPETTTENKGAIELVGTAVGTAVSNYLPTDQLLLLKSTYTASSAANDFIQWAWSIALKLKLYDCNVSSRATDIESSINLPFLKLVLNNFNEVASLHSTLLIYISFMLSATSRHFLRFESGDGWMKLLTILKRGKPRAIVKIFSEIIPSFVYMHGDDFFNDESLVDFLKHMVELRQDPMLVKASAKDSLNGIDVIISSNIWQAQLIDNVSNLLDDKGQGFSYVDLVMHSWLKTIFRKSDWMWHTGYVNIMNTLCKLSFTLHRHGLVHNMLIEEQKHLESAKLQGVQSSPRLTRFIKNMIPVSEGGFTTLLVGEWSLLNVKANTFNKSPGIENQNHWFAFEALVTETVSENEYKEELIQSIKEDTANDLNALFKLSNQKKPLEYFVIYRWLQHILILPVDHILLPLYLQIFFCLYYQYIDNSKSTLGQLFFNKKSELVTKLRDYIASVQTFYGQKMTQQDTTSSSSAPNAEVLQQTYYAMWLWLGNEDLLLMDVNIQELPAHYDTKRLALCHGKKEENQPWYHNNQYWMDLLNIEQLEQDFLNYNWEGSDKFRIDKQKIMDDTLTISSTINTRRQKFITGESTIIPLPKLVFNTPTAIRKPILSTSTESIK